MPANGLLQALRTELERSRTPTLARDLASELRRQGFTGVTRREVNQVLYSGAIKGLHRTPVAHRWRLAPATHQPTYTPLPVELDTTGDLTADTAFRSLHPHVGRRFQDIFSPAQIHRASRGGKGGWGYLFEALAGGTASSDHRDFVDGDLKTFACNAEGVPRSEVWLKNASGDIDEYVARTPWDRSGVGHKIARTVFAAYRAHRGRPGDHVFALLQLAELCASTVPGTALSTDYDRLTDRLATTVAAGGPLSPLRGDYLVLKRKGSGRPRPTLLASGRELFFDQLGWYLRPQFLVDYGHTLKSHGHER